ncbi:hypothetical protein LAZ67_2004088 [Cordylochernes scorpioides]|uniref:Reverse transcriptase domain-containing protein n=1 Tax=Cordylochernes scorpioides TaxID=51811 RepID=A0ABY6K4C4_9ARAC|nr:hypothetical protein LAZ67_2004088 [Cordylochernes scorpioides]
MTKASFCNHKRETENTAIVTVEISGAFDNAWHPAILQQLDKANFPAVLIKIINSYFEDRSVEFKYTNVKCIRKINKGCPQGGIISPILWNILFNDFNLSFNESFARVIAFADDVTFVVWSSNIYDLQYNITKCLIKIKAWCEKVKLSLSPNKTDSFQEKPPKKTTAVFLDMTSAFDRVWREKLREKLHNIGVRGKTLIWIADFLRGRRLKVRVNGEFSKEGRTWAGVTQGSVLSPLLYLLYINDIHPYLTEDTKVACYADDIAIWHTSSSIEKS